MRNLNVFGLAAAIALAVVACGPSSAEMSGAKAAHYKGDKAQLFDATKTAVEAKYKIEKTDAANMSVTTAGRWYTPEGLAAAESGGDMRVVPDKSLSIAFAVALRPDGDSFVVDIKMLMIRYRAGSPKPEAITEDDPSVPGFATGRRDALASEIHDALKQWEVQSLPAQPGAGPASAPPAAPAAPSSEPAPAPAPTPAT